MTTKQKVLTSSNTYHESWGASLSLSCLDGSFALVSYLHPQKIQTIRSSLLLHLFYRNLTRKKRINTKEIL